MFTRLSSLIFPGVLILLAAALVTYLIIANPLAPNADLTVCNGDEPQTLDPAQATGQLEGRVIFGILEGLTTLNAQGDVIPGAAKSWDISPDGKTYTFHMRPESMWSNRTPVTSYDFLNSWKRVLEPSTGAQYNYQLFYIVNAEAYATGKITNFSQVGLQAPDPATFIVHLTAPVAFFLELTSFTTLCPVNMQCVQAHPDNWTKPEYFVGNGAYLLKGHRFNNYIYLEASPTYWRHVPIHSIKLLPVDNANSAFNLFYSNKVDLILDKSSVPPSLVNSIKDEPYFHANPFGASMYIRFNLHKKPFDDVRVRKALAMAMDRQRIVDKITRAGEPVAFTLVPPLPGYTPPKGLPYDIDQARKLLADAGYPNGVGFPSVSLLYPARSNSPDIAAEMQSIWRENLGITSISIRGQEWPVYLDSMQRIDFDMMNSSWVADYADPKTFLDMFVTGGGNNCTYWSNPQYDALLAQAGQTPDPAARLKLMTQMEKILIEDDAPISPVYHQVGFALYDPKRLSGFVPNFVDDHRWTEMSLTPQH